MGAQGNEGAVGRPRFGPSSEGRNIGTGRWGVKQGLSRCGGAIPPLLQKGRSARFSRAGWGWRGASRAPPKGGSGSTPDHPHRLVCPTFSLLTNRLSTDVAAADYVDKCRLDGDRRHVKARSPEYGWERCGSVTRWKGSAGKAPAFPAGRSRTALSPRTRIRSGAWSAPPLFVSCVLNGCVGARPGLSCKDRSHGT